MDKGLFYLVDTADGVIRSYPADENGVPVRTPDGHLHDAKEVGTSSWTAAILTVGMHDV